MPPEWATHCRSLVEFALIHHPRATNAPRIDLSSADHRESALSRDAPVVGILGDTQIHVRTIVN